MDLIEIRPRRNWARRRVTVPTRAVMSFAVTSFAAILFAVTLSAVTVSAAGRHQILIYYANETVRQASESDNYAKLTDVLASSSKPLAARIISNLARDTKVFPETVRTDIAALLTAADRHEFDLYVFTNAMALDRQFLIYSSAVAKPEVARLPELPPARNSVLATSPLSRPDYFRAALIAVGARYAPDSLDAVLIANTHGSSEMALMPRVFADLSLANARDVIAELDGEAAQDRARPAWAQLQGTSKLEFWRVIAEVGTVNGMRFLLVFRAACESGVEDFTELSAVPRNVELVAHTGHADYDFGQVDYAVAFGRDRGADWRDPLTEALRDRAVHVDSKARLGVGLVAAGIAGIHPGLLFVPLAIWLAWYGARLFLTLRRRPA